MKLVLFDFDGTITTRDTYTKFILSNTSFSRLFLGGLLIYPLVFLNKIRLFLSPVLRPLVTRLAFKGIDVEDLTHKTEKFVSSYLPEVIRPNMLDKIREHKELGDRIIVVSASLSPYLKIWCESMEIEIICSELEIKNGRFTGSYVNGDCSGTKKVSSVRKQVNLSSFSQIVAYGDTKEDVPMLRIADVSYYCGKPFSAHNH